MKYNFDLNRGVFTFKNAETDKYWNTYGYPSLNKISNYKCKHGQQYTTISSKSQGITSSITYAIAEDDTREVFEVTLTNKTDRERKLSVFATTSFNLNGSGQSTYFTAWTTTETVFVDDVQGVFARNCNPCRPHLLGIFIWKLIYYILTRLRGWYLQFAVM